MKLSYNGSCDIIRIQNWFLSDALKHDCKAVSLLVFVLWRRSLHPEASRFQSPTFIHHLRSCLVIIATLITTFYDKVGWPRVFIYNALAEQLAWPFLSLLWHSDPYSTPRRDWLMLHDPRARSDLPKIALTVVAKAAWNNLQCHPNITTHVPV